MVFILVGSALRTLDDVRKQLTFFFVVATIVCAYGIYGIRALHRVTAPFEGGRGAEPNTFGGYVIIVMSVAGGLFITAPNRRIKLICLFLIVAAFIPFLYTLSRASYVAFLVALLALGITSRKLVILATLIAILCLYPILAPKEIQDRVNYTFQRGGGKPLVIAGRDTGLQVDKSTHERLYVWAKVRYNLKVWPWFGGGVSWETVYDSHYARVIIETGLLGFAAFLFMQYRILRTTHEAYRWSRNWLARGLALGAHTATIGLIVHAMGTISFLIIRIMEPFWFILALTVVVRAIAVEDHLRRPTGQQDLPQQPAQHAPAHPVTSRAPS